MVLFLPSWAGAQSLREMACNGGYEINHAVKALATIRAAVANGDVDGVERKLICRRVKKALSQNGYGGECGDRRVDSLIEGEVQSPMSIVDLVACVDGFPIDAQEIYADTLSLSVLSPNTQTKIHFESLREALIESHLIGPSQAGSLEDAILDPPK